MSGRCVESMDGETWRNRVVVAITGASGVVYGYELVKTLSQMEKEIHLILSSSGRELLSLELGLVPEDLAGYVRKSYSNDDMSSALSSGSNRFACMVVVPCSMHTLASIASGDSSTLVARVADIALKEGRTLVLVPRETPLNLIHIRNMETVTLAGATVLPAMPGFYHKPEKVSDMVRFVVGKILDQLGIDNDLFKRWQGLDRKPGNPGSA